MRGDNIMTNEHTLLARWINRRDEEAFHGLVRHHSQLVYATCLRVLHNDADAQDAALDAFLALSQLRRVPESPVGAWLHRAAVHRAVDHYRKKKTRTRYESAHAREARPETAAFGWDEISGLVDEAVAALPEELRAAVVGHFFEGRTQAELAEALGLTRQAISKRVHKGVEEVRHGLIKKGVTVGSVAALTLLLSEHAVAAPAVPAALAASLGKLALSGFTLTGATTGAAAGASLGLAAKALIAAVVLTLVAGVGYAFLPGIVKRNMVLLKSVPMAMAKSEYRKMFPKTPARTDRPGAAKSAAAGAIAQNEEPALEGGVTVRGTLQGMFGGMVGEADIVMEKITWAPNETPPAQTEKRNGTADSGGNFTIEHVPDGDWSISAWGDLGSGGGWARIENNWVTPTLVLVDVYPYAPCSGVVVDETGAPVPGAVIYPVGHELEPKTEVSHTEVAINRTTTDAEGRFHFDRMIEGGVKYFVAIPGGLPRYTDYVKTGGNARIQLPPPGRIRGRVVADGVIGGPEGVTLQFLAGWYPHPKMINGTETLYNGGRIELTLTTDRNGVLQGEAVPGAQYRVDLLKGSGWALSEPVKVDVFAKKESAPIIHVEQAKVLHGHVVDAQTGESLGAGVQINAFPNNSSASAETDADGYYRFDNLPKGRFPLQLYCPLVKGAPATYSFDSYGGGKPEWAADVQTGETRLDLRVDRTQLHGVVTDNAHAPVAGVEIRSSGVVMAKTGQEGRFDIRCISTHQPLQLDAEKEGWRALQMVELLPGGDAEANLTLSYPCTGELSGTVTIRSGESAAGMGLYGWTCLNSEETLGGSQSSLTQGRDTKLGANGEFSLTGLVPGEYTLSLSQSGANGNDRYFRCAEMLTLKPGEQRRDVRLAFEAGSKCTMAGVVVNEAGQPIPECVVNYANWRKTARTGRDGRFNLELESFAKEEQMSFYAEGYDRFSDSWELNRSDLVITLKPLQRLYGRVVDATGAPVAAYTLTVNSVAAGGAAMKDVVDASGAFDLPDVCPPPAVVTVSATGYGTMKKRFEGPDYGCPVEIVLTPPAVVEGTVIDADGNPLAGYTVLCEGDQLTTDAAGHFSSASLGAGTECAVIVCRTRVTPRLWWGLVTAPATLVCKIGPWGSAVLNVGLDGVPITDAAVLQTECTAKAEWQTENGAALQLPFYANPEIQALRCDGLPLGTAQVRVHLKSLEEFGPAVCEKVVEVQVVANQQAAVQVNFETPGIAAASPIGDTAPVAPGVTEE
jgi:RNA polymerase sigma factor (sigma-70 family)